MAAFEGDGEHGKFLIGRLKYFGPLKCGYADFVGGCFGGHGVIGIHAQLGPVGDVPGEAPVLFEVVVGGGAHEFIHGVDESQP